MASIPSSPSVVESTVIKAPLAHVWHFVKLPTFASFWTKLKNSSAVSKGVSPDTDVVNWTFNDGTVLEVKQEEHSTIEHFITYSVISATPKLPYSSVVSKIKCWPVTSGEFKDHTFVEWTGTFSNDADLAVIQDAKYKRQEALADLARAAEQFKSKEK